MIGAVLHAFPNDAVVGEEDADVLRQDTRTRDLVWNLARKAVQDSAELSDSIGSIKDAEETMSLIDRGNSLGGNKGRL